MRALSVWNPSIGELEKLGFPWILSSETSLFNGLRWIFVGTNFARPFPQRQPEKSAGGCLCASRSWDCGRAELSMGASLALLLFFCKRISALIALAVIAASAASTSAARSRSSTFADALMERGRCARSGRRRFPLMMVVTPSPGMTTPMATPRMTPPMVMPAGRGRSARRRRRGRLSERATYRRKGQCRSKRKAFDHGDSLR